MHIQPLHAKTYPGKQSAQVEMQQQRQGNHKFCRKQTAATQIFCQNGCDLFRLRGERLFRLKRTSCLPRNCLDAPKNEINAFLHTGGTRVCTVQWQPKSFARRQTPFQAPLSPPSRLLSTDLGDQGLPSLPSRPSPRPSRGTRRRARGVRDLFLARGLS